MAQPAVAQRQQGGKQQALQGRAQGCSGGRQQGHRQGRQAGHQQQAIAIDARHGQGQQRQTRQQPKQGWGDGHGWAGDPEVADLPMLMD